MKERKIELSANLKKYYNIMYRYYSGEFGSKHLTIGEILELAGEENLFKEMNNMEIEYLIVHHTGFLKLMFIEIQKRKLEEIKENIKSISLDEDGLTR